MTRPGRPDALSVRCPWCGADVGQWCEKVFTRRKGKQPVSFFVHPSRAETVASPVTVGLPRPPWMPLDPDPQF